LIRDAISYEIQRNGQVFLITALRISKLGMIQRLVPNARVGIGHGQMEGKTRGIDVGIYEW
jgi:transcription-repair coupling factor (superfamily II helicase)